MPAVKDEREFKRFALQLPASVGDLDSSEQHCPVFHVITRDISSRGAFLNTRVPLRLGARLAVEISLELRTGHKAANLLVNGQVVRTEPRGVALRFEDEHQLVAIASELDSGATAAHSAPPTGLPPHGGIGGAGKRGCPETTRAEPSAGEGRAGSRKSR